MFRETKWLISDHETKTPHNLDYTKSLLNLSEYLCTYVFLSIFIKLVPNNKCQIRKEDFFDNNWKYVVLIMVLYDGKNGTLKTVKLSPSVCPSATLAYLWFSHAMHSVALVFVRVRRGAARIYVGAPLILYQIKQRFAVFIYNLLNSTEH